MRGILLTFILFSLLAFIAIWKSPLFEKSFNKNEDVPIVDNTAIANNEIINKELSQVIKDKKVSSSRGENSTFKKAKKNMEISESLLNYIINDDSLFNIVPYKELELYNVNTRESLEVAFWADGDYIPSGLDKLDQFMRDWRKNQVIDIDPDLYMLLHEIYDEVDAESPIHLISGHRSQKTNDALRAIGRNTAKKSQHVLGKAADIKIPGIPIKKLRNEALEMKEGGVGYYPKDGFIHVDTGRVRQW